MSAIMHTHELNPCKGWPKPMAVDKTAVVSDGQPVILAGSVCSLDANAELVLGLTCGAMALFAFPNSTDFDVQGDEGSWVGPSTAGHGQPNMLVLPAKGDYELETTEFVQDTYYPNQCLTAGAPGADDAGKIKAGIAYTDTICGVVSAPVFSNEWQVSMLRFWPVWLPANDCGSSN